MIKQDVKGKYAPVNGLELYYETYGAGQPLVLLHGGFGTIEMFADLIPALAENWQVIGVELQAHGHTADIDRPLTFENMADDIAALIKHLGFESADIIGYSLGGGVAWQVSIRHPEVVRNLIAVSAPLKRDGWYPGNREGMASITAEIAQTWVGSPMHQAYANAAPKPEDWPRLATRLSGLLRTDYDWTAKVADMKKPTLIVVGDTDGVVLGHAVEMVRLLRGGRDEWPLFEVPPSQLAILPGTTHLDILTHADLLVPIISRFLGTPGKG